MKKIFLLYGMLLVSAFAFNASAQDENDNEVIRQKMSEFIQRRLSLSKEESEKFTPVFMKYFVEWRQTLRENRNDRLLLKQKIAELQLRYRPQFRDILGERRGNQVYLEQERFIRGIRDAAQERRRNNRPNKNPRSLLH